ncbi:MAG: nucleotidyltransferase domain-containing protein [Chloroflexi bacterium]|nr:nucleotidyltransferase domain-containing protein [Chloroflexota bacterium]
MTQLALQNEQIAEIVETIVDTVKPQRVVLFGSRASGRAREDSDYDLMVVMGEVGNERVISRRLYRALLDRRIEAAVDLIVVGANTLKRHGGNPAYIYAQALREGTVCYDAR